MKEDQNNTSDEYNEVGNQEEIMNDTEQLKY